MKWVTSDTNYMNVNAELQSESQSTVIIYLSKYFTIEVGQYPYIHGCLFLLTKV